MILTVHVLSNICICSILWIIFKLKTNNLVLSQNNFFPFFDLVAEPEKLDIFGFYSCLGKASEEYAFGNVHIIMCTIKC